MNTEVKPTSEKSRRDRRKEARLAKNKKKFDSWVQHHQSKTASSDLKSENAKKLAKSNGASYCSEKVGKTNIIVRDFVANGATEMPRNLRKSGIRKGLKRKNGSSTTPKNSFFKLLEMEMNGRVISEEEDLRLERRLVKRLKVKNGRLRSANDDIDKLLEGVTSLYNNVGGIGKLNKSFQDEDLEDGISSDEGGEESESLASSEEDEDEDVLDTLGDKRKQNHVDCGKKSSDNSISHDNPDNSTLAEQEKKAQIKTSSNIESSGPSGKYVAPHLRSHGGNEPAEHAPVRKRIRGLLNRISETNVESITGEISGLFHSVGRSVGSQIICEEVVASCSGGPRGNEQYAAVFAAFVAGMARLVGIDFGAKLLARLAKCFEEEYLKEDNLSLRNLTLLLSYLYFFGVCLSELIYDFLIMLGKRLSEVDVSTVLTVLQCCGMKLRGDDPVGMKNFILSVQSRVNELKCSSENMQSNISCKRMEFMIETICDIKNNKKRPKEDTVQHTRIKKWLQKSRVDDILIRGLKWGKLLDPNKKGQWWLSGDIAPTTENIEEVAGTIDKEIPETKKMLQLAASQRMNTDARRAIFCVIMSGEDYIDAFEKLLRLDLSGKQDREIMRVLVECCLQEKVFNKYYCVLASKLCSHDKNHKFTLQYCLWDHFKELESMPLIRSMHLSKFTAEMVASFTLSLAVLKAVDLSNPIHLTRKRIMHFRMLFEAIFESPDKLIWNIFTRIAVTPEYEPLRCGIEFFINKYVISGRKSLDAKFKIAKKALNNVEGVVM